jgi:hypothetical protein
MRQLNTDFENRGFELISTTLRDLNLTTLTRASWAVKLFAMNNSSNNDNNNNNNNNNN